MITRHIQLIAGVAVAALCIGTLPSCGGEDGGGSGSGGDAGASGAAGFGGSAGAAGAGGGQTGGVAGAAGIGGSAGVGAMGGAAGSGGAAGTDSGGAGGLAGNGGSGGNPAQELLEALGTSVWSGLQTRGGVQRAYELSFDADQTLWAELQNPFGPARKREMRVFSVASDGETVSTTVITPQGWPVPPNNGQKKTFNVVLIDGSPRQLLVERDGVTETYTEGAYPEPQTGLTAHARVFSASGAVHAALCGKGVIGSPERAPIWAFARDNSLEADLGSEIVAGVPLNRWRDASGGNQFALRNVPGFDRLGGTELSDQFNFIVRYFGTLSHPGGNISMREQDDMVQDAIWTWLGDGVGSSNTDDVFLEVHDLAGFDLTSDVETANYTAGALDFEAMVIRCNDVLEDVDIQVRFGSGAWQAVGAVSSLPEINDTLFPPTL